MTPLRTLFLLLPLAPAVHAAAIPFPAALDDSAVVQERITDLNRHALTIGNGDLNALVWERDGSLCLRVAKNDIWDARIDTSRDPALLKVDLPSQKWSGGGGNVPSWGNPYPSPRGAAIVRIGSRAATGWTCIRALGATNAWTRRSDT